IDSGIDYTHPDLGGGFGDGFKVVGGYDFVDEDDDPMDTDGHGTAVAGVIGAEEFTVDGRRMRGIAPEADLVALRVNGGGESVTAARMEEALQWVLANRETFNITAVNLSLGSGHYDSPHAQSRYGDELEALADAGVLIAAASGNNGIGNGPGIDFPAAHPDVLSVGGVDRFGVIPDSVERGSLLDVLAPGVDVPTLAPGGGYVLASGTSFATPFLAGLYPLFKQLDPLASVDDFRSLINAASDRNMDGDEEFGITTGLEFAQLDVVDLLTTAAQRTAADPLLVEPELGNFGNENDLVHDDAGVLHYAWFDSGLRTLRYATQNTDGLWSMPMSVDDATPEQGHYVSMALDSFGRPSIAYYDGLAGDLKFATLRDGKWSTELLEFKGSTGLYPSLVFEADDTPALSYYRKQDGDLRLFRRDDAGEWTSTVIDGQDDAGRSGDLEITPEGRLAIAYDHTTTGQLRIAEEQPDGQWFLTVIDPTTIGGVAFIDLEYHENRPHVSYYDAHPADLKIAERTNGLWSSTRLQSKGPVGLYTQLHFDDAGMANILFYDRRQNRLDLATEDANGNFGRVPLAETGGRYVATAVFNDRILYTYRDTESAKLVIDDLPLSV
ncbi:MAG: S8/S53 family peptidase, partial [Planctomycetota bacterium]